MKILRPKKVAKVAEEKPKQKNTLPKDEYPDLIDKRELVLGDTNKLVFSVSRGGEYGLPMIDIRHYAMNNPKYSGPTKKGIRFSLEMLYSLMEILEDIDKECDEKGIGAE